MNSHSRFFRIAYALTAAALTVAALLYAQTSSTAGVRMAEVRVETVELSDIGQDSIQATVRLSAIAKDSASLRVLVFDNATINGLRVRVPPVSGPIRLRAGEGIDGLPELQAVLMFRELDSLEPLRRAVRDGRAEVHALVRAQVELNLFQKLVLWTGGAWVTIPVDQEVPVDVPGGTLGRMAAIGALTVAEPAWIANQSAREWLRNRTALAGRVRAAIPGHLVSLETRCELKSRDGETATLRTWSGGFVIGNGYVVAPAEAVEPWSFDDSLAEAMENGDVTVNEPKTEVLATLVSGGSGAPRTFSLQRKEVRIAKRLSGSESAISVRTKRRYHVRFRNRDFNAVLLGIPALTGAERELDFSASRPGGGWQQAAVVQFDRQGNGEPKLWLTEALWEDGRYRIKDLVDATAFGSPLWIDGSVAGLLQDESSAAEVNGVLKKLR